MNLATMSAKEVQKLNGIGSGLSAETFERYLASRDTGSLCDPPGTPCSNETIDPFTGLPIEANTTSNGDCATAQGK